MHERISEIIIKQGFEDFKLIAARDIHVAQWVRVKCQFGCTDYGNGTCPPNTPSVEECQKFFNEYSQAALIRLTTSADKENYPSDWSKEMTGKLLNIERQLFLSGYYKVFLLNQTCCCSCKQCVGNRRDCTDKAHSRPSPEGFAVDVYQTCKNIGMDILVIENNPSIIHRVALLMIE